MIYSIANQKGGVGKTTTAVNLGAGFAQLGKKVLVVDLDQQANATVAFGLDKSDLPTSYEVLSGEVTLSEAALPAGPENVWLVPASRDLAGAVVELPTLENPNSRLSEQLGSVDEDYDMVLIDCPPALGPITVNALVASDRVIIPVQAEYLALEGLVEFLDTISMVRQQLNPGLEPRRHPRHHARRTHPARPAGRGAIFVTISPRLFSGSVIPRTVRVAEAPSYGIPVTDYAPSSRGSEAYLALAEEVLSRG